MSPATGIDRSDVLCCTCRRRPATHVATIAPTEDEARALQNLAAAFGDGTEVIDHSWPICGSCIDQAARHGVLLDLVPLPTGGP